MDFYEEFFSCDKCKQTKHFDGSLCGRDPRLFYKICKECRDILVDLLSQTERKTLLSFLQPERLNPEDHIVEDNEMMCDSPNHENK